MSKGDKVSIKWEKTSIANLRTIEDTYFYALLRGDNVLYIGIAYHQNVADEVNKTINRLDELDKNTVGLYVCLGYITESTYGRITEQIVKDVECALIYHFQPPYNTHCTSSYKGRKNLTIYNKGCITGTVKT